MNGITNSIDLWHYERLAISDGFKLVAGVDEAGRGPIAGPVVAAAVILPLDCDIAGINDSKQLTPARRESAFEKIHKIALGIGVGIINHKEIDRINILQATYAAMRAAIADLNTKADIYLVDGSPIRDFGHPHKCIVKGDSKSASIAAASIIAKVTRDRIMCEYDARFPQYGFAKHKGYPSPEHVRNLTAHGACAIHRRTFEPVKSLCGNVEEIEKNWVQTELNWEP